MEVLFLGQLDLIQQPHVRLDTLPGHLHFAHPESSPFVYGKVDVNPLFIIGNLRASHPDIHKTMIQVEGGNHIRVNFQLVPLENSRFSEPEKTAFFRSQDNIFEVIIRKVLIACEGDLADIKLVVLLYAKTDIHPVTLNWLYLVGNLRIIIAFVPIKRPDLFHISLED